MKKQTRHADESVPHSVTELIKLKTARQTIQIAFTDQKVSAHAGLAAFAAFLHWHRLHQLLSRVLPHRPTSNHALNPVDIALGFLTGIISGACKLTQVAHLRADPALPPLLQVQRLPSQSTLSRFFGFFNGAAVNWRTFDPLWNWCLERLNSRKGGYTLDLDTTQLLHKDAQQCEGVRTGYTPRGLKPCLHPLLAFLGEAKLVAGFWLRPGNTVTFNNVVAFTSAVLQRLPRHIRIGLVRADAGFYFQEWLQLLEQRGLSYIVVGKLYRPLRAVVRRQACWQATHLAGTEVADAMVEDWSWKQPRRVVLVRHRIDHKRPGGRELLEVPGYTFQVLVTNLSLGVSAMEVWQRYNGRAGSENIIKELDAHFGLPQLCLRKFWATEAALSLAVFTYNLSVLFQRHLGWQQRVSAGTLQFLLWSTGGIVSRTGGQSTLRLAVVGRHRLWWRAVLDKLLCPWPNCNAVEPRPASA